MTMRGDEKVILKKAVCLPLIALVLSGCTTVETGRIIKQGDKVGLHFTCSFPDGSLAASTNPALADDPAILKSPVFLPKNDSEPLTITAGERIQPPDPMFALPFEYSIADKLADMVVGMREGEKRTVTVTAERTSGCKDLRMALVRKYPKEMHFPLNESGKNKDSAPKVGADYTVDPDMPGKVTSVTDKEVVVRFTAKPGTVVETPFGKGTVRELLDRYEIVMDVRKGSLVRSADMVGIISSVTEDSFTVDFCHPIGGQSLSCEIAAVKPETESK
jgi:FKBP-type peptidyl-prolyl cis-trans isomerase 2